MNRNPDLKELLELTGFEICEFEPCPNEPCNFCKKVNIQLYYGNTGWDGNDGDYACLDCINGFHQRNCDYDNWINARLKGELK